VELQDELVAVMNDSLVPIGFRRRGSSWHRTAQAAYAVVNLQRSNWDDSVYVNVGFSPAEQATRGWIPETKCQVRFRVDSIRSVSPAGVALLNDAELTSIGDKEWRERIRKDLIAPLVELLERAVDLESLGKIVQSELSAKVMIHREVRARIGLSPQASP
jgi:hypothetical protein